MNNDTIDITFPIALVYGEFTHLRMLFSSDSPMRPEEPRCLDVVFKEGEAEIHLDMYKKESWQEPNAALDSMPWTKQFISALRHFGTLIEPALKIDYVARDKTQIETDMIIFAFAELLPEDEEKREAAQQAVHAFLAQLQRAKLL